MISPLHPTCLLPHSRAFDFTAATKDTDPLSDKQQIHFLTWIYLLAIPRPIEFKTISFLFSVTQYFRTLGGAQSDFLIARVYLYQTSPLSLKREDALNALTLAHATRPPLQKKVKMHRSDSPNCLQKTPWPKTTTTGPLFVWPALTITHSLVPTLSSFESHSPGPSQVADTTFSQAHSHPNPLLSIETQKGLTKPATFDDRLLILQQSQTQILQSPQDSYLLSFFDHIKSKSDSHPNAYDIFRTKENKKANPQSSEKDNPLYLLPVTEDTTTATHSLSQKAKSKTKGKNITTRRSQHLQERKQPDCSSPKPIKAAKTKMTSIPFQLNSHDIPLQIDVALRILQESRLQIDHKVQDMVYEASKVDLVNAASNNSSPSTLVHDHIPPLMLSRKNILL